MPYVSQVSSSGDAYVDGLLSGVQWNKSLTTTMTYSFPTVAVAYPPSGYTEAKTGFAAVSDQQMVAIQDILGGASGYTPMFRYGSYASVIDYTFVRSASPTDGTEDPAILRIAQSSEPSTAWAYYPDQWGSAGGDVWFGDGYVGTPYDYRMPTPGTYMWHTAVHELGHAMGLKHGQEIDGPGNTAVPADRDAMEFTVMTYRSYVGGDLYGYTNEYYGYAQTLMMYDIAALQYMYGANFTTHAGRSIYRWDPLTGEMSISENGGAFVGQGRPGGPDAPAQANRVFLTIWDGNGNDTYDMSNYTGAVSLDLRPGQWSITSNGQRANLGDGHLAQGNVYNALMFNGDARSLIENAIGGSGHDTLTGNEANNVLNGGVGADTMAGGLGNDAYYVDDLGDVVTENAGEGTDTVVATIGYALAAHVENLRLSTGANVNATGNGLDNVIYAGSGNNLLDGGDGTDTLSYVYGHTAGVTVSLASSGAQDTGGSGTDTVLHFERLAGTNFADALSGDDASNVLNGYAGNDTLTGLGGNDVLNGGAGADAMAGGLGNDAYYVDDLGDVVTENADEGTDTVVATIGYALAAHVENLRLSTTADVNATGNGLDNVIYAGSGSNLLDGGDGTDTLSYVYGHTAGVTVSLASSGAQDTGGSGTDTVLHFERLAGTNFADALTGDDASNVLTGYAGNDTLTGLGGNDVLNGGAGADAMAGGLGNDAYYVDDLGDVVTENAGEGTDTVVATIGYALAANVERLTLGGTGAINGTGNSLANTLVGNSEANRLDGGAGNDWLCGRGGMDLLTGGTGNDSFVFDTALGGGNIDTVLDFTTAVDKIRLDDDVFSGFNAGTSAVLAADQFLAMAGATAATDAAQRIVFDTSSGGLYYDADGVDGVAAVQFATLQLGGVVAPLAASDFLIIA